MHIAVLVLLGLLFGVANAQAQTTATYGESQVGVTNCNPKNNSADYDTVAQCNASSGTGTFQKAPLFVGAMTSPPYSATTCTSSNYGMLQYTSGNVLQVCVPSGWVSLAGSNTANAFSFTNQTSVSQSATISSNAVTLSGFTGTLSATCGTGCTNIARNGTWCTCTTLSGFNSGDTIAIQQTSSSGLSTTTNATVTVGTTTSGTWSVTTNSNTANAFSFTNQSGVSGGVLVASGDVALSGWTGTLTATCGTGCVAIGINSGSGDVWGGTVVTGIASGSSINIRLISSSTPGGTATATVTVGNTTSSTWTVTTSTDACAGVSTIGGACPDGEIYAGTSGVGTRMYAIPCDYGASGSQGSCGTGTTTSWNSGGTNYYTTGTTSNDGKSNTSTLITDNGVPTTDAPYKAATECYNLTSYGFSVGTFYLPSKVELATLYSGSTSIGGFNTSGTYYWSSTEYSSNGANGQRFSDGNQSGNPKYAALLVRCVRRL